MCFFDLCGLPAVLRSDRGLAFTSEIVAAINSLLGIDHAFGSAHHPQYISSQLAASLSVRQSRAEQQGRPQSSFSVGDCVFLRWPQAALHGRDETVSRRLLPKAGTHLYRIHMTVALQIVILAHPDSGSTNSSFANLISTSCLVRYDLCDSEHLLPEDSPLKLELRQSDGIWRRVTILVRKVPWN